MYLARLKGFEPLAHGLEGRCSIRLSYRRKPQDGFHKGFAGAQRKQVPLPLTVIDYSIIPERCQQVFGPTGTVLLGSLSHCSKTWFQKEPGPTTITTIGGRFFYGRPQKNRPPAVTKSSSKRTVPLEPNPTKASPASSYARSGVDKTTRSGYHTSRVRGEQTIACRKV